jgi:hypothetical protein
MATARATGCSGAPAPYADVAPELGAIPVDRVPADDDDRLGCFDWLYDWLPAPRRLDAAAEQPAWAGRCTSTCWRSCVAPGGLRRACPAGPAPGRRTTWRCGNGHHDLPGFARLAGAAEVLMRRSWRSRTQGGLYHMIERGPEGQREAAAAELLRRLPEIDVVRRLLREGSALRSFELMVADLRQKGLTE